MLRPAFGLFLSEIIRKVWYAITSHGQELLQVQCLEKLNVWIMFWQISTPSKST